MKAVCAWPKGIQNCPRTQEAPEGYPRSKGTRLAIMSSTMAARSYSGFHPSRPGGAVVDAARPAVGDGLPLVGA